MVAKIHILKPEVANRIAAGEVVQRPASAVKELIENALDANATHVTIIVKDAGKSLIQVIDNGEGMSAQDAVVAFQRHTTSKIAVPADLENIRTLGFRGEALASIAAVAQVEMRTRINSDEIGTLVRVDGNEVKEQSKVNTDSGTNVVLRNIFYNTPARRSFLKSDQTELKNITDVVTRFAVAYPEIGCLYQSNDEVFLDLKPKPIEQRLKEVFGERQSESLVPVHESTDYLTLDGFIGKPNFARKTRVDQFLFINRRFVVNRTINHAVFHAYEHLIEKGSYPFFILNLTVDPRKVDVNVHPSKMEVKFENESNVYRFVLAVVRKTLAANDLIPSVSFAGQEASTGLEERLKASQFSDEAVAVPTGSSFSRAEWLRPGITPFNRSTPESLSQLDLEKLFHRIERRLEVEPDASLTQPGPPRERILPHESTSATAEQEVAREARAIWQLHNKYILSQIRTGLLIVDQHVAHERILYEQALANFENHLPSSQQLLFPQTIQFSASDYALVKELLPHLESLGFDIKLFGKNTVVVEGIPADVRVGNEAKILQDVLDEFKNNEHPDKVGTMDARDNLAKSFSCKTAIKAGDKLNSIEMIALIDQLFQTKMPYVCPHGRPIVVKISTEELDRRFGRT